MVADVASLRVHEDVPGNISVGGEGSLGSALVRHTGARSPSRKKEKQRVTLAKEEVQ